MPRYLRDRMALTNLMLAFCLLVMCVYEPIFRCLMSKDDDGPMFNTECKEAEGMKFFPYSVFSMISMFLYFLCLMDMSVFHTRVSSYVLVCGRMLSEVGLTIFALCFLLVAWSASLSCLVQDVDHFKSIQDGSLALFEMFLRIYSTEDYEKLHTELIILIGAFLFIFISLFFLLNMLIAQLTTAYDAVYTNMVGFARLNRIKTTVEIMSTISEKRWKAFLESLHFDQKLEFNPGDVGLSGGLQILEPANLHPQTTDAVRRYGGPTVGTSPWPDDTENDEAEQIERLSKMVARAMQSNKKHGQAYEDEAEVED